MESLIYTCEVIEIEGGRRAYVYTFEGTGEEPAVLNSSEDES